MGPDGDEAARAQYLSFVLAGGEYGTSILKVKEILQFDGLTKVPGTSRAVKGVINLRGSVVPVVDLAVRFGLGETRPTQRTCVLVVETEVEGRLTLAGILADAVNEVLDLASEDVAPPPRLGAGASADYLVGMGKLERRFVLILDVDRVLALEERGLAEALRHAEPRGREGSLSAEAG